MKYLYYIYQLVIALPIIAVLTVITSLVTAIGCTLGNGHFWGYYPGRWWARAVLFFLLIPVKVNGRENIEKNKSYVFVANHQGAFDIFLIYGYLGCNFKWMMKWQLRKMPFVGFACEKAHHIFVDKRSPRKIKETYDKARATLCDGTGLVVFPEGSRSFNGHMGTFKRGAFMLADELGMSVIPMTIDGSFNIMPRTRDMKFVNRHKLTLTIHPAIHPESKGAENIKRLSEESYKSVMSGLPKEYQGFVENPDQ